MLKYDVHTHAFHPKIAEKATAQLYDYYHIHPKGDGTLDNLRRFLVDAGLDRAVVHSAATCPEQVVPANNWAIHLQQNEPGILAFGTVHTGFAGWEKELDRLAEAGIKGLKLHPDFQRIWLDDPALDPVFEAAAGRFVMMFHVGDQRSPQENYSCPFKVAAIKRRFPKLQMIAAHLGGLYHWEHVPAELGKLDIYIDTSSALPFVSDEHLSEIRKAIPRERWLFGSDYPLYSARDSIDDLQRRLQLSSAELEEILTNANRLFGD